MFGKQKNKLNKNKKKNNNNSVDELISVQTAPVSVWALYDNNEPDKPLTFAVSYEQIYSALDQLLYLKSYPHFRQWCALHDIPVNHRESWARYSKEVISNGFNPNDGAAYTIARVDYQPEVIAAMIRSLHHCEPFGNSFESREEEERIGTRLAETPEEELTPIEKNLLLLFEDIEEDKIEESAEVKSRCPNVPLTNDKGDKKYDA